jgi:hypothetical protein
MFQKVIKIIFVAPILKLMNGYKKYFVFGNDFFKSLHINSHTHMWSINHSHINTHMNNEQTFFEHLTHFFSGLRCVLSTWLWNSIRRHFEGLLYPVFVNKNLFIDSLVYHFSCLFCLSKSMSFGEIEEVWKSSGISNSSILWTRSFYWKICYWHGEKSKEVSFLIRNANIISKMFLFLKNKESIVLFSFVIQTQWKLSFIQTFFVWNMLRNNSLLMFWNENFQRLNIFDKERK